MRSRSALTLHSAAPGKSRATAPAAGVQSQVRAEAAADDDQSTSEFSIHGDPLFGMAIASLIMFAVLAALVALS